MREGDFVAVWLSSGRLVTRWKNARATISNAIVAKTKKEVEDILTQKFGGKIQTDVGIFQFAGLSPSGSKEAGATVRNAQPISAFAMILSPKELRAYFENVLKAVEQSGDEGLWVECFIRPRTRREEDDGGNAPPNSRGRFRRD